MLVNLLCSAFQCLLAQFTTGCAEVLLFFASPRCCVAKGQASMRIFFWHPPPPPSLCYIFHFGDGEHPPTFPLL